MTSCKIGNFPQTILMALWTEGAGLLGFALIILTRCFC